MEPCGAAPKSSYCFQVLLGVSGWAGILGLGAGQSGVGVGMRLRPSLQAPTLCLQAVFKPGAFFTSLGELCGRCPHWSLLQLLTEVGALDGQSQGAGCAGRPP